MVGLWRAWGVYSVFILEDVADLRRLSLFPLRCLLRLFCKKGLTVDFEKVSGLGLFGKSGAGEKLTTLLAFLAQFLL